MAAPGTRHPDPLADLLAAGRAAAANMAADGWVPPDAVVLRFAARPGTVVLPLGTVPATVGPAPRIEDVAAAFAAAYYPGAGGVEVFLRHAGETDGVPAIAGDGRTPRDVVPARVRG